MPFPRDLKDGSTADSECGQARFLIDVDMDGSRGLVGGGQYQRVAVWGRRTNRQAGGAGWKRSDEALDLTFDRTRRPSAPSLPISASVRGYSLL